jgi:hypothetical protein
MTVMKRSLALFFLVITPHIAGAQETLRDAVGALLTNQAVQTGDFQRDRAAAEAARDTLVQSLLVNLTTAPIGTSSGGFLYRLNPELGTVERASESFGTFFVERALTAGQGCFSFGFTTTTSSFNQWNGTPLADGSLITVANKFRDEAQPFDTEALSMHLRASTVTLLGNIGVTDHFDVGVAVPIAKISLDGQQINMYRGTSLVQASADGTASGLADIAVRAKYAFVASSHGGIAASGEIRLPTGDEQNLLGAGSTSWRILGVGSLENGPVGVHFNGGIVRGGVSDETIFSGALSVAVHPRATFTGEFLQRHVSELREFVLAPAPHPTVAGVDTFRLTAGLEGTNLLTAIAGVKWNVTDTLVIGAHVLWPVIDRGLTSTITPSVGIEYSLR